MFFLSLKYHDLCYSLILKDIPNGNTRTDLRKTLGKIHIESQFALLIKFFNQINIFMIFMRSYGTNKWWGAEIQQKALPYFFVIADKFKTDQFVVSDALFNFIMIRIHTNIFRLFSDTIHG